VGAYSDMLKAQADAAILQNKSLPPLQSEPPQSLRNSSCADQYFHSPRHKRSQLLARRPRAPAVARSVAAKGATFHVPPCFSPRMAEFTYNRRSEGLWASGSCNRFTLQGRPSKISCIRSITRQRTKFFYPAHLCPARCGEVGPTRFHHFVLSV